MKVCVIYYRYPVYKGGSHITDFVEHLCSEVEEVVLISSPHPEKPETTPSNLVIHWMPVLRWGVLNSIFFELSCILCVLTNPTVWRCDVINAICLRGTVAAKILSKLRKIPLIVTIELLNTPDNGVSGLINTFQRFVYKMLNPNAFISWSKYHTEKYMRNIIPDNKEIVCIPNGVDTIKYNTEIDGRDIKDKYSPDKPLIVFAKPLYDYNTPSAILLVETINELKNDMPVNLLLGDGDGRKKVENAASRLNVTDRVFFMPWVPMTEIPKYLAASDIIVLPYLYEATTSRSFLEALAMGKATIISNLGEPAKLVKNMEECIIVNPTVKELIPAMKLLLINTDIRTRLEVNARKKALDYSFEKVITKTVDVYNKYCNVKK